MRSLSWKLAGTLLLIVAVAVGLMAYLVNLNTRREFQQYVVQGAAMHAQGVAEGLASFYAQNGGWSGVQQLLSSLLVVSGDRLIVADQRGVVVGDTDGAVLGQSVSRLGLSGFGAAIEVSGQDVGSYYLLTSSSGMGGMMGGGGMMGNGNGRGQGGQPVSTNLATGESQFLANTNRALWIAGLSAAALAIVAGWLLTRYLLRPVTELRKGAAQISRGNLDHRAKVLSNDELGDLTRSFNSMADSLAVSEAQRRRMTADIAHELRTPLTIIEGTVDGMLDGVFPADAQHLAPIKEQTAMLTRLIGDLRDVSLAESGQLKLEMAPENVADLARRTVEQTLPGATQRGLRLTFAAEDNVPPINLDRMRMEQVVGNLLTNALRHTPSGGAVSVSVKRSGQGVLIAVADTGEGIAPEHLPHIFERFYRASDARARSDGGTGLGLAIVKHLVQAHGGRVWAESTPGQGSTFFVQLPATAG